MRSYRNYYQCSQRFGLGCLALALACAVSQAQLSTRGRLTIAGSVFLDGETQPVPRVQVNVRALSGNDLATTFTDASGRFEAPTDGNGSFIVSVQQQGYEPVEQRVNLGFEGAVRGLVIKLHKVKPAPIDAAGYTVSVRNLKLPAKARRAFEKGLTLLQKKDAQASLERFKEATDAFPNYYEAYYQIGVANLELRRGDEAEQALQTSIDLSGGGYAEPQFALGAMLCDRQDYAGAERVLRRAIDVDANSWKGHLFLGQTLFGENRLAEAEKSAREVLLRHPDQPTAYILLANIHIRRQEFLLGIQDLDTFLSMKPTGPTSEQARAVRAAAERVVARLHTTAVQPIFMY